MISRKFLGISILTTLSLFAVGCGSSTDQQSSALTADLFAQIKGVWTLDTGICADGSQVRLLDSNEHGSAVYSFNDTNSGTFTLTRKASSQGDMSFSPFGASPYSPYSPYSTPYSSPYFSGAYSAAPSSPYTPYTLADSFRANGYPLPAGTNAVIVEFPTTVAFDSTTAQISVTLAGNAVCKTDSGVEIACGLSNSEWKYFSSFSLAGKTRVANGVFTIKTTLPATMINCNHSDKALAPVAPIALRFIK